MSQPGNTIEVFFSYAPEDEALQQQLKNHLRPLPQVNGWSKREIPPGVDQEKITTDHLNKAQIILLLVSPDFIASDECSKEVTRAMERLGASEACVFPVILRPVLWKHTPFGHLQPLPVNGTPVTVWEDQQQAFVDIVQGILKRIPDCSSLKEPPKLPSQKVSVISVMGAKGGVGKGLFVSCTAQLIADGGHDVAVVDLDLSSCGATKIAIKFFPMLTSTPVKTVFDHLAPHAVGFRKYKGTQIPLLWDITPEYLHERKRGNIYLLPAREDYLHGSAYAVIANIPDASQKSREEKLVELIKEMLERVRREHPTVQCILIDCGADSTNPIYSAAFACADYRYILTLPDDTYFANIQEIQSTYWQRYPGQAIFIVGNRVMSRENDETLRSSLHSRGYKGYIPLDPQLEEDVFAGGSVDYDLGYNNVFMSVRNCLPEELLQGNGALVPDPVKVRIVPWFSRFVEYQLAERTLQSDSFVWGTRLLRTFTALLALGFLALFADLIRHELSPHPILKSSVDLVTHFIPSNAQVDLVPLCVLAVLVGLSIPFLLRQEKKRRLLKRISLLKVDEYGYLEKLLDQLQSKDQRLYRWLNVLLIAEQVKMKESRRREAPFSE